jgi:transcription elongation GreA/GreB family factor
MTLKQKVFYHYQHLLNEKISLLKNNLADLKESSANETKSTAGDKHETALAMLQIEQANTRAQLNEILEKKAALERIDPTGTNSKIGLGSLIETNRGFLFLSVAAGKANINGMAVLSLSPQSPLGSKLMGLSPKSSVKINQHIYIIKNIY